MVKPVIFILGVSALPLAQRLKAGLGGEIHTPDCVQGGDATYPKATTHLAELFNEGSAPAASSFAPLPPISRTSAMNLP
jgi:cobalt-precorrin 5A hydrolase / precorrin-3B C17-methyltransferase